jgi:2'-hydroxyisoflavone reductase
MKILVLGGTVYLSKKIATQARDRGHAVTVAARGTSGEPPEGVRFIRVDRDRADGLAALADESYDAVVDVARLPGQVGPALDALASRVGHWSFVSTASVYADTATPGQSVTVAPVLDPAPADSVDPDLEQYGPNKVACENLVLDRAGTAFIVRAGLIIGTDDPLDRFGYWPQRIAAGGEVLAPGDPAESVQYIDVRDLAAWILDAAEAGTAGVYDGVCPPLPRGRFLAEIAAATGPKDVSFTWVPQDFLLEHEIRPWAGPDSLGLWVPLPDYTGFLDRDTSPSVAAGMWNRPPADSARTWQAWAAALDGPPRLAAGISREKEAAVLAAWHATA